MNLLNNMTMLQGLGTGNILKPAGLGASLPGAGGQQGLLGFLNLIMQSQGATQDIGDLAARIAQLLKTNPNDQAGLEKLVSAFSPEATPELAAKIAETLKAMNLQAPQPAKPLLISDLSALQQEGSPEMRAADILASNPLADLLNQLQPGSGDTGLLMQQLLAADAGLDDNILAALQAKFAELKLQKGEIGKDALVAFKADITAFLQDKGFDAATVQRYLAALAKTLRSQAPEQAGMPAMPGQNEAPVAADPAPVAKAAKAQAQAPQAPTMATAQQAAPQAQTQAPAAKAAATSNLAIVNALNSGDAGYTGDFSQQGGFPQNASGEAHSLIKHADAPQQGFVNYMSAARGHASPTVQMVGLQIQRNAAAKIDTFTMQLDPADLGRLDISLKFDADGGVKAHLVAERPETLALLQRDSSHLEKILQQSGLDVDSGSLSFDLRDQGRQAHEREANNSNNASDDFAAHMDGTAETKAMAARIAVETYGYITQNSVNIMV